VPSSWWSAHRLAERHPEQLWALTDNLRQNDPANAARSVSSETATSRAVGWYARNGRSIRARPPPAVTGMIRAWAADIDADGTPFSPIDATTSRC